MNRGIRVVAPFRPFAPESPLHQEMAAFDWIQAMRMMVHSAELACHCPVHIITDVDTDLPVPTLKYETHERRLMLWTLEACAVYLESDACDRDTVMVDVDQLLFRDLAPFFRKGVDLGLLVRTTDKHTMTDGGQPLLNGVQFWRRSSRYQLAAFYRRALKTAKRLPEDRLVWGADTDAVRMLIEPIELGLHERFGLVVEMIDAATVLETYSSRHEMSMRMGYAPWPTRPVLDFRWTRKVHMPAVYKATILNGAVIA